MAEYQLAEERIISGKGVLKIPADKDEFRHAYLCLDVIREPRNKYLNLNWNPPQSKYAFLVFRRNEYVVQTAYMQFENEMYDSVPDITSQNLIAIKCMYDGILQTFFNLGNALELPSISITDLIKDYESLSLQWDEVLIKCYADTAIQARLFYIEDDTCDENKRKRKKVPPPPPKLPKVPPGTPIGDISEPYDDETMDDGNTEPYQDDEIPEPEPEFPDCTRVRVLLNVKLVGIAPFNTDVVVYAPFGGTASVKPGFPKVAQAMHRGQSPNPSPPAPCLSYEMRDLISFTDNIESISVVSVNLA